MSVKQFTYDRLPAVVITSNPGPNTLGVIRCFGRRKIPVIYIDIEHGISRYSRYIGKRVRPRYGREFEETLIDTLVEFGSHLEHKPMIIPTGDDEVLAISKHKAELEKMYLLPVSDYNLVEKLVNKKLFYKMLAEMQVPHPATWFPGSSEELLSIGKELPYPYIIKPAFSLSFRKVFDSKCLVIRSLEELKWAVDALRSVNEVVVLQEIIPGDDYYEYYTYLNKDSLPLAACGWRKVRHYPPHFGSGSFCRTELLPFEVEKCNELLVSLGYHGFAGPELVRDPRDGSYKLLEINARTTLQNRLAAASDVDIEYLAYLDMNGFSVPETALPVDNVIWIDDFLDLATRLILLKRKEATIGSIFPEAGAGKVYSVAALDDPAPLCVHMVILFYYVLVRICRIIMGWFGKSGLNRWKL
jgi:D-aspartate ligase